MYFRSYGLPKTWLDNCLKSPFSEDPPTRNMVNGLKHYWNINNRSFTTFFDNGEENIVAKCLS